MIQAVINEILSTEIKLQFEIKHELLGGIELVANGQKVAWSIVEYLASLEKGIDALIGE